MPIIDFCPAWRGYDSNPEVPKPADFAWDCTHTAHCLATF